MRLPQLARRLGRAPYRAVLVLARGAVRRSLIDGAELWARNSFLTGAFRPLRSDLDLTLWIPGTEAEAEHNGAAELVAELLRLPGVAEINVVLSDWLGEARERANPCELARDPELRRRVHPGGPPAARDAERAAYLLRMLEAAGRSMPAPKWRSYWAFAGLDAATVGAGRLPVDAVAAFLAARLGVLVPADALEDYLSRLAAGPPLHLPPESPAWAHGLFPHRLAFVPPASRPPPPSRPGLAAIRAAQIEWERWGLRTQSFAPAQRGTEARTRTAAHLRNLESLA